MSNKELYLKHLFLLFNININCNKDEMKDMLQFFDILLFKESFQEKEQQELIEELNKFELKMDESSVNLIKKILENNLQRNARINDCKKTQKIKKIIELLEFYVKNYNLLNNRIIDKANYKKATDAIFKKLVELNLINEEGYKERLTKDFYDFINKMIDEKKILNEEYTIVDFIKDLQFYCFEQLSANMHEFQYKFIDKILFFYFSKINLFLYVDEKNKEILPLSIENLSKMQDDLKKESEKEKKQILSEDKDEISSKEEIPRQKSIIASVKRRLKPDKYLVPIACAMIYDDPEVIDQLKTLTNGNDEIISYINDMAENFHEEANMRKKEVYNDYVQNYLFLNYDDQNSLVINLQEKKIESVNQIDNIISNDLTKNIFCPITPNDLTDSYSSSNLNSSLRTNVSYISYKEKIDCLQVRILEAVKEHKEKNKTNCNINFKNSKKMQNTKKQNIVKISNVKNIVPKKCKNKVEGNICQLHEYSSPLKPKYAEVLNSYKKEENTTVNLKTLLQNKVKKIEIESKKQNNHINLNEVKMPKESIILNELIKQEISLNNEKMINHTKALSEHLSIISNNNGLSSNESLYEDMDYKNSIKTEMYGQSSEKSVKINGIFSANYLFHDHVFVKGYVLLSLNQEFPSVYFGGGYFNNNYGISALKNITNFDLTDISVVISIFKVDISINLKNKFIGFSYYIGSKKDFNFHGGLGLNKLY